MGRWLLAYSIGSALAVTTGCASIPRASSGPQERGPKVLLEWADKKSSATGGDAEKPDPAANGNGARADATASNRVDEEPDVIVTDRPDFTEASSTVGKGRVQLEAGYTFTRDRTNGERFSSHSYPETLLRVGLFADWFEFRLGQNFGTEGTALPDGTRSRAGGADDLYLGVKLGLTEQKAWHPEMALILQMTVPSGSRDFSAREVLPGVNLLYGWDVIKDRVSVGGSTQANSVRGDFELPEFMGLG